MTLVSKTVLTRGQLNHLEWALAEVRRTGSYYGAHGHFVRRQAQLEDWVKQQREMAPRRKDE